MLLLFNLVFSAFSLLPVNGAPSRDDGWVKYEEEVCIQAFEQLVTYAEAQRFCSSLGDSPASLVMVKREERQEFLVDFTKEISDYIWLGASYDGESSTLLWQDGTNLTYTNWQEGYPRNITNGDACLEMRPGETKSMNTTKGKWAHVTCKKRNLVLCQKPLTWTLNDAVAEIMRLSSQVSGGAAQLALVQSQLEDTKSRLNDTVKNLEEAREQLNVVTPVGSIYIEYYGQPSPQSLWPSFTWQDISSSYAGLFFRALGGASAAWGSTQADCAPRITQIQHTERAYDPYPTLIDIPASGWSSYVGAGENYPYGSYQWFEALRFYMEGGEVRPTNQAIRIWKRIR